MEPLAKKPIYIKASEVRKLVRSKGKRASKDFLDYINKRVESMVTNYIHVTGSRKTLRAIDLISLDEFNKGRR